MYRYKDQDGNNEFLLEAGDTGFLGVNSRLDPGILRSGAAWRDVNDVILGPGLAAKAVNCRFRRGVAETRPGSVAPRCFNPWRVGATTEASDSDCLLTVAGTPVTLAVQAFDTNGRRNYRSTYYTVNWTGAAWQCARPLGPVVGTCADDVRLPWMGAWTWADGYGPLVRAGTISSFTKLGFSDEALGPTFYNGPIHGTGIFSDPDGLEWLMVACPRGVWLLRDGCTPRVVGVPGGLDGEVDLVQAFDSVVMLRGPAGAPLAWDGALGGTFKSIARTTITSGSDFTAPIPRASSGVVMANRLFVVQDRDSVAVSDILDFTRYDPALSVFRINTGEDDAIVCLFPHRRSNLLVFKDQSIHAITNITASLATVGAEVISPNLGCAARRTVAAVGGDVYFLSHTGVFKISEVVQESMQAGEVPVSQDIADVVARINWDVAGRFSAVAGGDYYRLSVALDGSQVPNVVLVYDTARGMWQGWDEYPAGFHPHRFARADWCGSKRTVGIDIEAGVVAVLDEGPEDFRAAINVERNPEFAPAPITSTLRTRGYMLPNHTGTTRFRHGQATLETWAPSLTIRAITDGVAEEETLLAGATRSRTAYQTHGAAAFDPGNDAHDHGARGREDYSVVLPDAGMDLGAGIDLELHQQWTQHVGLRAHGTWLALEIECAGGRMAVRQASVDGGPVRNAKRAKQ